MHTPQHYRELAEQYAAQAMRATDPQVRIMLAEMAQYALQLARQAAETPEEKPPAEKRGG